ncbi:MAG: tRNA pseudouridine(38-40) synthase TruA, partial [Gammaproteobacteria bacterium]|nr:tRNA pseudouridine(38-40) synthase TruA [Gammaproteobacteria bacterium]
MRIAAGIEYYGSAYAGWQIQAGVETVQMHVEQAFSSVADRKISITCAGRTDAGVHATGQVIHFDTDSIRSDRAWTLGANANLPHDINVSWVKPVPDSFHARFSALARAYRYVIHNRWVRSGISAG